MNIFVVNQLALRSTASDALAQGVTTDDLPDVAHDQTDEVIYPTGSTMLAVHVSITLSDSPTPADHLVPKVIAKAHLIKAVFDYSASKWKEETANESSIRRMKNNDNYRQIVRLGEEAIPLILDDIMRDQQPAFWFPALKEISGVDPVLPEHRGNVPEMTKAWIAWAQNKKIL